MVEAGTVLTILSFIVIALASYYGWQRTVDGKFAKLDKSVAEKFAAMDKGFDMKFTALALQINTILVGDVANLRIRVDSLEVDNRELHRQCTVLTTDLNGVGLKLDRLERPNRPGAGTRSDA